METFDNWGDWCRLAIPGVIVYFLGSVTFEIYVIASGLNGSYQQAAMTISMMFVVIIS